MTDRVLQRFTAADKAFLAAVRDDVVARPEGYRAGMEYLLRHFSEEAVYEDAGPAER